MENLLWPSDQVKRAWMALLSFLFEGDFDCNMKGFKMAERDEKGRFKARHGMYGTRLYHIWNGINARCSNPNNKDYKDYGARGIKVCEEWKDSARFFKWALENGYEDFLTIDRIDNNKGYCPENCRWISIEKQQVNKRNVRNIEYNGETHCIAEWNRILRFPKGTIESRIWHGWDNERALSEPIHSNKSHRKDGKESVVAI